MFTALLDTCVLYPSVQRDFLLSLAVEGLYRPVWSSAILTELRHVEVAKLIRRGIAPVTAGRRAEHLVSTMRRSFDDAEVQGWEPLDGAYGLPDPDDEHLVAAAVVGGAGVIVTHNLRDLPAHKVPGHIEVQRPSDFAWNTVATSPTRALSAIEMMAARTGRRGPVMTVDDVLDQLSKRYEMDAAVELIRVAR